MDPICALELSYDQLRDLVAGLGPADLGRPTPCGEWDVRAVLNHVLGAARMFTLANQGRSAGPDSGDLVGSDPAGGLAPVRAANLASWESPDAMEGDRCFPFGTFPAQAALLINTAEVAVHTWDVARATGRPSGIDAGVASLLYRFFSGVPLDEHRAHGAFGPEIAVPLTASDDERLLAYLGRQP